MFHGSVFIISYNAFSKQFVGVRGLTSRYMKPVIGSCILLFVVVLISVVNYNHKAMKNMAWYIGNLLNTNKLLADL